MIWLEVHFLSIDDIDFLSNNCADVSSHLEEYTHDIGADQRENYLTCLDSTLFRAEQFRSQTLPWFVATTQNRDVIFWIVDAVCDPLATSGINFVTKSRIDRNHAGAKKAL